MATNSAKRVLLVSGGFRGLGRRTGSSRCPVELTLIDRCNHHLLQPLLCQVATAALSPAEINSPIRSVLRDKKL